MASDANRQGFAGPGVERYEELRGHVVGGSGSCWRLGLAVLEQRGVAAWLQAWRALGVPTPVSAPARMSGPGEEVVGVLAAMALACVRAG